MCHALSATPPSYTTSILPLEDVILELDSRVRLSNSHNSCIPLEKNDSRSYSPIRKTLHQTRFTLAAENFLGGASKHTKNVYTLVG